MRFAGLMARAARWLGLGAAVLALAACGGGGSGCVDVFGGNACGDAGGGGGGTPVQALTLNLQLLDGDGKATTSVVVGQPLRATAVLRLDGQAVSGEIVQFGIEQSADLVKIDPVTGSPLTTPIRPGSSCRYRRPRPRHPAVRRRRASRCRGRRAGRD